VLDHLSIQCADPATSAAFYDTVLATVGGKRILDFGEVIGYGGFVRDPDGNNVEAVSHRPE